MVLYQKRKYLEREYALQEISFDQTNGYSCDGFYDQFEAKKGSPWGLKNSKICKMCKRKK